jgi:hypothetical protein
VRVRKKRKKRKKKKKGRHELIENSGKPYKIRENKKQEPETDAVVPIISIAETPLIFRGVRGPAFQEFAYLYSAELKRRKDAKKRDKFVRALATFFIYRSYNMACRSTALRIQSM